MNLSIEALKALGGFFTALAGWSAGMIAQTVDSLPTWVKAADTPLVVLGLGYGIIHLWRELAKERNARIADRDTFIDRLDQRDAKSEESRAALLKATLDQTGEFRALRREISRKRLHTPAEGED